MKKAFIYTLATAMLLSSITSCTSSQSTDTYIGTMAGAEIGGTIGEAIGWMATSRHDGPGKAMLGSIIGTIAGAAIGNSVAKNSHKNRKADRRGNRSDDELYGYDDYGYESPDYQTSGGYDMRHDGTRQGYNMQNSDLTIRNLNYQDEDGDGRFSRYETINIIYEVTNTGNRTADVVLLVDAASPTRDVVFSPANNVTLAPYQTIRYKAKAFCKNRLRQSYITIVASARSREAGNTKASLRIRCR